MPPKRPKGLMKSALEPAVKRVRTGEDSSAVAGGAVSAKDGNGNAGEPQTVMLGDLDAAAETPAGEVQVMLRGAVAHLAGGQEELGRTLLRGVLHESTRLLSLNDLLGATATSRGEDDNKADVKCQAAPEEIKSTEPFNDNVVADDGNGAGRKADADEDRLTAEDRTTVLFIYAQALALLATFLGQSDRDKPVQYISLADEELALALASSANSSVANGSESGSTGDSVARSASLCATTKSLIAVTKAVLAQGESGDDRTDQPAVDDATLAHLSADMLEALASAVLRQLSISQDPVSCAILAKQLWSAVPDVDVARKATKSLGLGQALVALASNVVADQGDAAEADEEVDRAALEAARSDLELALELLQAAHEAAGEKPTEQVYLPLAEARVNLGTLGEMMDDPAPIIIEHYSKAIELFCKAKELDPECVDNAMIEGLEGTIVAVLDDQSASCV